MIKGHPITFQSRRFNPAVDYARARLSEFGFNNAVGESPDHPALAWKRSGLMRTTGHMLPSNLVSHVDGALLALKSIAPKAKLPRNAALLMGERARLRGTVRQGRSCAGGYGRLLDGLDGRIALNLVRDDDWDLIPAWLETNVSGWEGIVAQVKKCSVQELADRAAQMGLAVAIDHLPEIPEAWFSKTTFQSATPKQAPILVDLSGLWAGPLASSLLQSCGARVIKVEGSNRPDGMRSGHKGFYELLNSGKACAAFDFKNPSDIESLKSLLDAADIVIEASRPRAFEQLDIRARDFVSKKPGKIWARLTAYGRGENRIGFGDDIGISAGLASLMDQAYGEPCFVGDAIADPVNGVHMALAIWAHYQKGGGAVLDFAMIDVLRFALGDIFSDLADAAKDWTEMAQNDIEPLYNLRKPNGHIHSLGQDTAEIIADLC